MVESIRVFKMFAPNSGIERFIVKTIYKDVVGYIVWNKVTKKASFYSGISNLGLSALQMICDFMQSLENNNVDLTFKNDDMEVELYPQ